jgi:hypothetical protein
MPAEDGRRLIALGASNLTRGLRVVVETARQLSPGPLEVFTALGHGRSYGTRSRFLARELPGILECGLWRAIEGRPARPTTALVTDVGNDVLYGADVSLILAWVGETLLRLRRLGATTVLADLPVFNVERLSPLGFALFRSILVPSCRLSLAEVGARAAEVNSGLAPLAARHGATLMHLRPEWYGYDPIHMLSRHWTRAWQTILLAAFPAIEPPTLSRSPREWLRLYRARPEQRWLFGREQRHRQPALQLPDATTVWIY